MNLTPEEIERYAPYHTMCEFETGFTDYELGQNFSDSFHDVAGQAYDRGAECAMRRQRGE
jgi:hypothetical protein